MRFSHLTTKIKKVLKTKKVLKIKNIDCWRRFRKELLSYSSGGNVISF